MIPTLEGLEGFMQMDTHSTAPRGCSVMLVDSNITYPAVIANSLYQLDPVCHRVPRYLANYYFWVCW